MEDKSDYCEKSDERINMKKFIWYCDEVVTPSNNWQHPLKYMPFIVHAYIVIYNTGYIVSTIMLHLEIYNSHQKGAIFLIIIGVPNESSYNQMSYGKTIAS